MSARRLDGGQVPGPSPEAIGSGREGTDRTDLDGVAREVRRERQVREGVHLGVVPAVLELDERVAGDLVGEPGAAGAQDAALTVQQHEVRDGDRLLIVALLFDEPRLSRPVRHRLVLEWALAASVTDRAVERVVDEEELEDSLLSLLDGVVLSVDHHAVGDGVGTGGDQRRSPRRLDLDQTHAAHPDGVHSGMPAEARDVGAVVLGGLDDQLALLHVVFDAIDRDGDQLGLYLRLDVGHAGTSVLANGQAPSVM